MNHEGDSTPVSCCGVKLTILRVCFFSLFLYLLLAVQSWTAETSHTLNIYMPMAVLSSNNSQHQQQQLQNLKHQSGTPTSSTTPTTTPTATTITTSVYSQETIKVLTGLGWQQANLTLSNSVISQVFYKQDDAKKSILHIIVVEKHCESALPWILKPGSNWTVKHHHPGLFSAVPVGLPRMRDSLIKWDYRRTFATYKDYDCARYKHPLGIVTTECNIAASFATNWIMPDDVIKMRREGEQGKVIVEEMKKMGTDIGPSNDIATQILHTRNKVQAKDMDKHKHAVQHLATMTYGEMYWNEGPGAYHISLPLPDLDKSYTISIRSGFDDCLLPLESLSNKHFGTYNYGGHNCYCNCTKKPNYGKLVEFDIHSHDLQEAKKLVSKESKRPCDYADLSGSWHIDTNDTYRYVLSDTKCTIHDVVQTKYKHNVCLIGASHTNHIKANIKKYVTGSVKRDDQMHPSTYEKPMRKCSSGASGPTAIVMTLGSHEPGVSPREMANGIKKLADKTPDLHHAKNIKCIIVTSILPSKHENYPGNFGVNNKYFRNSWRQYAKNALVRKEIANITHFEYLDTYSSSEALYYDSHKATDGVHFAERLYNFHSQLITSALIDFCT